ncbi:unnamed protein product, partial [marine sediment metagenome]
MKRREAKEMRERARQGYAPADIAKEFKRDLRTVKAYLRLSDDADGSARQEWYLHHHLERLRKIADQLRLCLHNPHLELEPYIGTGQPLWLGDHDWALVPGEWVEATTP